MKLAEIAEASAAVAGTRSRTGKRAVLAELLRQAPATEVETATAYLSGSLPQRRTGLGWRSLSELPAPAERATLELDEVDRRLAVISELAGPGSAGRRREQVDSLFGALTLQEQGFLRALLTGGVRQGALDAVMLEAIAEAAAVPVASVRRASMFSATTGPIAFAALTAGEPGLEEFTLATGRPVRPMLASSAPTVVEALARFTGPVVVDTKLDGIRIQVHKRGSEVRVFTRSLEEVSARLPQVVAFTEALPARDLILDGEALGLAADGRPRPFQETAAHAASYEADASAILPFFFDLLAHDGEALTEAPARQRWARLAAVVPASGLTARIETDDPAVAQQHFERAIAAGFEGVIVKDPQAPYEAGRRGSAWIKVKPRHTLDLVVLAVEHGSGRRTGLLSNIHLGARDPAGGFVMLGKTFKEMTDEMLVWQTERFSGLRVSEDGYVVTLRPEQVVEIAFDGVQRSSRYPGGVALRFARVLRYRDDKPASEADTIGTVRALRQRNSDETDV